VGHPTSLGQNSFKKLIHTEKPGREGNFAHEKGTKCHEEEAGEMYGCFKIAPVDYSRFDSVVGWEWLEYAAGTEGTRGQWLETG
jgi:hypothetical protein